VGDLDGDDYDDVLVGTSAIDVGATNGGAAYLLSGPLDGIGYVDDMATAVFLGTSLSLGVGRGLSGGTDLTGDDVPDLVIGAGGMTGDASTTGGVFVIPGERM